MIFEAIAAIKIANEAIGAIKEMAGNISSVGEMGSHLSKLADAKETIKEKANNGDSEAFWALENINQQEKAIREIMIYGGRAHLYSDYEKFMANRKQMRENQLKREKARKLAKKKAIKDAFLYGAVGIFTLGIVGGAVAFIVWLVGLRGD